MLRLKGKIFEIGDLEDGSGRGIRVEREAGDLSIIGLTKSECRAVVRWFGETVEITVDGSGESK